MLQSMTGYGRSTAEIGSRTYTIELKGVNHRYLDIKIRLPREYFQIEELIRKEISKLVSRGRIDVYIHYEKGVESQKEIVVDKSLVTAYYKSISELAEMLKIDKQPSLEFLASRPEVISMKEPEENFEVATKQLLEAVIEACKGLKVMRQTEGARLAETISKQLDELQNYRQEILSRAPDVVIEYQRKLQERIAALLDKSIEVNQDKLATEVAYFADRASINEEVVRLDSHVLQFRDIVNKGGIVGRKMDFIVQEMNREVNTIGSKSSDIEISKAVVEMKSLIEKIREQVQNIE